MFKTRKNVCVSVAIKHSNFFFLFLLDWVLDFSFRTSEAILCGLAV